MRDAAIEASFALSPEQAGLTLAAALRAGAPGTSWSQAKALCAAGRVRVDGAPTLDPARRMRAGERVEIARSGGRRREPEDLVVHLDSEVVVVRKPAGVLTVPFAGEDDTLLARARVAVRRREAGRPTGRTSALRAVQRLDKETSGLVVFARTIPAQRHLQEQLSAHTMTRRYLAIVHGAAVDAVYESLLVPDRGDGLRGSWGVFRAPRGEPPAEARAAITRVEVLERLAGATLVACELATGRQHQIRIHLSEAGHSLVGETVYVRDRRGSRPTAPRPMLHATALGFAHPRGGRPMRFEEPPPADFAAVLAELRQR